MKILDIKTKNTKYKTHKFKKTDSCRVCTVCKLRVYKLETGIWVEDLNEGMLAFLNMSLMANNQKDFEPEIEMVDVSNSCNDYLVRNIIE